jgi:cytochrome c oxidase subunit III
MTQSAPMSGTASVSGPQSLQSLLADVSSDQRVFKNVPWAKVMMWVFLLGDVFVFSSFLIAYMNVRMSTQAPWPHPTEVFALTVGGKEIPLLLVAVMTFVLTSSCGTMSLAVGYGYQRDRQKALLWLLVTALLGASFVGMQAIEWSKLIHEGVRPWANPMGAAQFGASFFMITGFHGTHVTIGVIFLIITAVKVARGDLENMRPGFMTGRKGGYEIVEIMSLYWHFVDLVWVFIFAVFYLW